MRTAILSIILTLTCAQAGAQIKRGGQEGSGGGGVITDKGVYVTIGTAGFFVNPEPKQVVPSLDMIEEGINNLKISDQFRKALLEAVYPIGNREYYDIQNDGISNTEYSKLVQQYADLTKYPADKVALFAVTNTQTRTTYFLPAFYQLKPTEQAAILFHEAYWILKPGASYAEVVRAEIAFQKWIELGDAKAFSAEMAWVIQSLFAKDELVLNWALASDLAKGNLGDLATEGKGVSARQLIQASGGNINKLLYKSPMGYTIDSRSRYLCMFDVSMSSVDVYALSRKYPKSVWLQLMAKKLASPSTGGGYGFRLTYEAPIMSRFSPQLETHIRSPGCVELDQAEFDWNFKSLSIRHEQDYTGKITATNVWVEITHSSMK